jgi:hypothetical protein
MVALTVEILQDLVLHLPFKSVCYIPVIQEFLLYIVFQMARKKTMSSKVQSPSVTQRALLADQNQLAKASWKDSAMTSECGRQRQLLLILLTFSRAVQAAMCVFESTNTDEDEDFERSLKSAVDDAVLLYQQ